MILYRKLQDFSRDFRNFAYFCRFDRANRKTGKEMLFLSNLDPIEEYRDVDGFFSRKLENAFSRAGSGKGTFAKELLPVFVSYDFISSIYPDLGIRRSGWPLVAALQPETVLKGEYNRKNADHNIGTNSSAPIDRDLQTRIGSIRNRIYNGEALQVVVSRRFNLDRIDPFAALNYFMESDQSLYVYYYRFGDFEIIGSSPENVVSLDSKGVEINPIAGTRPRGHNPEEDAAMSGSLLNDEKELMEHRMLVDLARNDLGKISSPGTVRVTKSMEIQKFASVQHLVSTVTGIKASNYGIMDVIKAVFPAGTVSGAPKKRAMRIIEETENTPRGAYAGAVGLAGHDYLDLALLIRSIFSIRGDYYTQAGAGIVKDSNAEKEVREIFSKSETVFGGVRNESVSN